MSGDETEVTIRRVVGVSGGGVAAAAAAAEAAAVSIETETAAGSGAETEIASGCALSPSLRLCHVSLPQLPAGVLRLLTVGASFLGLLTRPPPHRTAAATSADASAAARGTCVLRRPPSPLPPPR